jgi:DNA-binding NtrC family response regulator
MIYELRNSAMPLRILIADDEKAARFGMAKALARGGYVLLESADVASTLDAIRTGLPDLVFLDLTMPDGDARCVLRELAAGAGPACEIVVVTAHDDVQSAVECLRLGAADYLTKPYEIERVRAIAQRCAGQRELAQRARALQDRLDHRQAFGALVGVSRPMQELFRQVERIAPAAVDVLIRGETGTGKELIARELHRLSHRAAGPFVAVNTAAIAESLAESELFGHVKGAFTGADANRAGVFEQAAGGTLFLDEVGDMPLPAQAKILRALQERAVRPVGGARTIPVDVRVVTATHMDLGRAIAEGHFRQDLYFRIKGVELHVPPLRARHEDVIVLADWFLTRLGANLPDPPRLAQDAVSRLLAYPWPGNVRELEHVLAAAVAMASGPEIHAADLRLPGPAADRGVPDFAGLLGLPLVEAKEQLVAAFERAAIQTALDRHDGNVSAAARHLGIHRQSLQQKLTVLGIRRV